MIELLCWTAVSLIAFLLTVTVYVVSQAVLGLLLGIRVERVAIGYDVFGIRLCSDLLT